MAQQSIPNPATASPAPVSPPSADRESQQQPSYDSDAAVMALFDEARRDMRLDTGRSSRDKENWHNILMHRGGVDNQWSQWDAQAGVWRTIPTEGHYGLPDYVFRACTNWFARHVDGITALLNQSEPALEWGPGSDADEDVAASDVIQEAVPVILEECDFADLRMGANQGCVLTDKVAVLLYYDSSEKWGMRELPVFQCEQCREYSMPADVQDDERCPTCGGTVTMAFDSQQPWRPIGVPMPVGRLRGELLTCFEFSLPSGARTTDVERLPWIDVHQRFSPEEAAQHWPEHRQRFRTRRGGGGSGGDLAGRQQYADALVTLSGPHAATHGTGGSLEGPVIHRFYHDPVTDPDGRYHFPDGLFALILDGEVVLEAAPLPVKNTRDIPLKPVVIRQFAPMFGSAHGKPPADDLTPLQIEMNYLETLGFLTLARGAAPTVYIPDTCTLHDEPTGQPNEQIRYHALNPGDRPHMEPGQGPHQSLQDWIIRKQADMDKISGLNAILMGERPAGDPTLGEAEMLREQGMGTFKTPLLSLIAFDKAVATLALLIARTSFWSPRFRRIRGENGQWELSQFAAADLAGNVDVTVNPVSAWPKSPLMQNLRLQKAIEYGIVIPAQDPELSAKILSNMDLTELKPSLDVDQKQIARELDEWKAAQSPMQIRPPNPIANLEMHLVLKRNFLKGELAEKLRDANPPTYAAMMRHVQALEQLVMARTAAAQAPAPAPAPAGQEAPPGPDGSAMDAAIESGALTPAEEPGEALEGAIQAGALTPAGPPAPEGAPAMSGPPQAGPSADVLLQQQMQEPLPPPSTS